ncbi:MAG: hypothetical protein AB1656_27630 [Candidatus Omnitrophota bacterium]
MTTRNYVKSLLFIAFCLLLSLFFATIPAAQEEDIQLSPIGALRLSNPITYMAGGSYVYCLNSCVLLIVDISNPSDPQLVGKYRFCYNANMVSGPFSSLALEWPYLYVPTQGGFDILDVSDATAPSLAGEYRFDDLENYTPMGIISPVGIIHVKNGRALISIAWEDSLETIDVSNVSSPRRLGKIAMAPSRNEYMQILWDGDSNAYALLGINPISEYLGVETRIFDLSSFDRPRLITTIATPGAKSIYKDGDSLFIVAKSTNTYRSATSTIQVYHIEEPNFPNPIATLGYDFIPGLFYPYGPYLFTRNYWDGRMLVLTKEKESLRLVKDFPESITPEYFLIHGDLLIGFKYDWEGNQWLTIYNISPKLSISDFSLY